VISSIASARTASSTNATACATTGGSTSKPVYASTPFCSGQRITSMSPSSPSGSVIPGQAFVVAISIARLPANPPFS
jgi:hypothetical protein